MTTRGIIESNPEILGGKPVIKGTRIPVRFIFDLISQEYSVADKIEEYPSLTADIVEKVVEIGIEARDSLCGSNLDKIIHEALSSQ